MQVSDTRPLSTSVTTLVPWQLKTFSNLLPWVPPNLDTIFNITSHITPKEYYTDLPLQSKILFYCFW